MDAETIWILVVVVVGFLGFIIWHFDIASRVFVRLCVSIMSKEDARDNIRNDVIPEVNKNYPEDQGDGFILTTTYLEGDYHVFRYLLDGEEATIEALRESGETFVNEVKATIINEYAKNGTNSLYIKAEYGIIFEYVEQGSDEKFIVKVEYTEMDVKKDEESGASE
jgi:hypothetical protein